MKVLKVLVFVLWAMGFAQGYTGGEYAVALLLGGFLTFFAGTVTGIGMD